MKSKKENLKTSAYYSIKKLKKIFRKIRKIFSRNYKFLIESLQISGLYFYAIVTLMYTVINCLGTFPDLLYKIVPFADQILSFSPLRILATPEKTFLLYLGAVEFILNRKSTALIVKYNFLLIFILEMVQNLIIALWDLFSHRDLDFLTGDFDFSEEWAINFFTLYFIINLVMFIYCYISAMMGKFPSFPGPFRKVTDSIAFWLNIKRENNKKDKSSGNN